MIGKNSNCDNTEKKTKIVMKLENSNWDQTQNSNCDENQKLKL